MKGLRAFTLLELVVSISILVLLAGVSLPLTAALVRAGKNEATAARQDELAIAVESYFADVGAFPAKLAGIASNPGKAGWKGPYAAATALDDAFDKAMRLEARTATTIAIHSAGADHKFATADDVRREVNVAPRLREITRARLDVVNAAIVAYNRNRGDSQPPLPADVASAFSTLVTAGYLPNDSKLKLDGFGSPLEANPPGQSPLVAVKSPNMNGAQ
jgi:general secretion pathway protein G